MKPFSRFCSSYFIVCLVLLFAGCSPPPQETTETGGSDPSAGPRAEAETAVIGRWMLDGEATSKGCERLTDFVAPNKINELVVESKQATFDLDINADGTFEAHKVMGIQDVTMSGEWHIDDEFYLVLEQKMQGDQPVSDRMNGRPDSRSMRLMHAEEDFHMAYVFVRRRAE